jgi:hypothetical protein
VADPGIGRTTQQHEEHITVTDDLLDELMGLLRAPSTCYLTTLMPDGSPQPPATATVS